MPSPIIFEQRLLQDVLEIESFSRGIARIIVALLNEAEQEGLARLALLDPDLTFTRRFLAGTINEIDGVLRRVNPEIVDEMDDARFEVTQMSYDRLSKDLKAVTGLTGVDAVPTKLPTRRLKRIAQGNILGSSLQAWADRQDQRLITALRKELGKSVALNETVAQAKKRLVDALSLKRSSADVMARTGLLQTAIDARDESYKDNDDIITGFQYLATLDIRVCPICAKDDKRRAKKRKDLPSLLRHPRCRCTIVPLTAISDDFAVDRPAVTEQEKKTTQHRDGSTSSRWRPISAKRTSAGFPEFFKRQPKKWQREWLGAERFKLWESGTLTDLRDLALNRRVLNLEQLKERLEAKAQKAVREAAGAKPLLQPGQRTKRRKL